MKKLDHAIILTAMEAVSKLSGIKIDAQFTIESFSFLLPKLPDNIKTAAQFNEYVEEKIVPALYNNVTSRFTNIAKRYLDNIKDISEEDQAMVRKIFDEKISQISVELLDASSNELKYYNCNLEWLESTEEKLSCSYYLRSSLNSCVKTIFDDIFDMIISKKSIELSIDIIEVTHTEPEPAKETKEVKSVWPLTSNPVYFGVSETIKDIKDNKAEQQPKTEEPMVEGEPRVDGSNLNNPKFARTNPMFPGFLSGKFNKNNTQNGTKPDDAQHKSEDKKDEPAAKVEAAKKEVAKTQKQEESKENKNKPQQAKDAAVAKEPEQKSEEPKSDILETPEDQSLNNGVPKINIQIPTPSEIQDLVSKPQQMVNFEAPVINPQYPDNEMIVKHFLIGRHVNISESDYDLFKDSILTAADWIEDYDKEFNHKTPTTFAFAEFRDVNNYTLVRTIKVAGKYEFLNPDDKKYIIINVENDTYNWFIKDDSNNLVHANIA